uniref:Aminopeptidase n=1 Tax=Paramormyrops kingsleyae TaxID=1676925 RepID=A0A3B3Q832_9TELE
MGKGGFYISKAVGVVAILLGAAAVATIIALSVVYAEEKSKNEVKPTEAPTTAAPTSAAPSNEPWDKYRLPDTLMPEYYNITLWPRLQRNESGIFIFTGKSFVVFKCLQATNLILIHSNKLNYTKFDEHHATLTGIDDPNPPTINTTWLKLETQFLVIQLKGNLLHGKSYRLDTEFVGELADDLGGFYRSEYSEDNVTKVVATTQMQPTDARKAFPCFDEPAMKAVFHITLIHDNETKALSNGKEIDTKNIEGNLLSTTFEPTERMSTYLLAFIVSDYDSIEQQDDVLVTIRIWARKKAIADGHGEYALNITGPILQFFQKYYNASYPLSKSDQIALPDFNAGAMENWGLITYRETALLYDPQVSSNGNKERIATVISHELAHMWFGNLVTMKWWNDLWLNEGFASYVEYLGADHAEPTWNIKDLIVLGDVYRVFAIDALASSHPLSSREDEINKPEQISELFDAISYSKVSSLFVFDICCINITYLNHFAYNNTVYTDLWDHLQTAADTSGVELLHPVRDIMDRWVLQMGFPVVTINTATGTVSQKHFLLDPDSVVTRPSEFNYQWYVPIKWMKTGIEQEKVYWLQQKEDKNDNMSVNGNDWLLANLDVTGYYRVNYDNDNWERLLAKLTENHTEIPVINRGQILDDSFNLARAKIVSTTLALRTTKYLYNETEYIPWQVAINNLDYFILMFDRTEVYGPLQAYLGKQIKPLWDHFTQITDNWTKVPDNHMDQYNEVNAIKIACSTGFKDCQDLVKYWYTQWMQNPNDNPIHPNLRSTVYCSAIAEGGDKEWNFGWEMFQNASIASEAEKLRAALACTKYPWLLNRYLEYTLVPKIIRKQDATSTIIYIANNVVGQPLAWDFVRARWDDIFSQYGGGSFSFSNLINGVTKRFSTAFELRQLEQFKKDNAGTGLGSGTQAVDQSIERTKANMKWVAENKASVLQWFTTESG